MAKLCLKYETGRMELIERDGFSLTTGRYTFRFNDSEYRREEEE